VIYFAVIVMQLRHFSVVYVLYTFFFTPFQEWVNRERKGMQETGVTA